MISVWQASWIMQGSTTLMVGVDGSGNPEVKTLYDQARQQGVGVNFGAFVGYAPSRKLVIGGDARAPTAAELLTERQIVAKGECEGASGSSNGLW